MLTPEPGLDPMEQIERMESGGSTSASADDGTLTRRLADALRATDTRYEQSEFEFEGATALALTAEDGIEITLWSDHASFNFPYWESLDAQRITHDIETAARIIAGETGWKLYDPQLERFIDPTADAAEIRSMFDYGREKLTEIIERDDPSPSRPTSFWKRLFRS